MILSSNEGKLSRIVLKKLLRTSSTHFNGLIYGIILHQLIVLLILSLISNFQLKDGNFVTINIIRAIAIHLL